MNTLNDTIEQKNDQPKPIKKFCYLSSFVLQEEIKDYWDNNQTRISFHDKVHCHEILPNGSNIRSVILEDIKNNRSLSEKYSNTILSHNKMEQKEAEAFYNM